jgi:hypothetical protein
MSVRRSLISLTLALFAAGCIGEGNPLAVQQPLASAPHFLRWAGTTAPQFTAIGAPTAGVVNGLFLASASSGLRLDRPVATFWAVRGESRSVQINYADSAGGTDSPFMRLVINDPTYVPGQGDLAPGDSVLITVTVDTENIAVSLEPTGLVFGDPAQLEIWYGGAGGDLNGDGVVDSTDAYIESQLLGMRYREGADDEWTDVPATQWLSDKSFTSALPHFCVYAVSW